jgi:hypothetical protein
MERVLLFFLIVVVVACGGRPMRVPGLGDGGTGSQGDASGEQTAPLSVPPTCENVAFEGTFVAGKQIGSFAVALQAALSQKQLGLRLGLGIEGASNTDGLRCFDGMTDLMAFRNCKGPLRITELPKGLEWLYVESSCPVSDTTGLAGMSGEVSLEDASLTTDFSGLADASYVLAYGHIPLERIAPYVRGATVLFLEVTATSLSPLNGAAANYLWISAAGLHSVEDYSPSAALACFEVALDPTATSEEKDAVAARLCSSTRSAPECPNYGCCWDPYLRNTGPGCRP